MCTLIVNYIILFPVKLSRIEKKKSSEVERAKNVLNLYCLVNVVITKDGNKEAGHMGNRS